MILIIKTTYEWLGKVIYRELCKKVKFNHSIKLYLHKPESVLENDVFKILKDFEIQTYDLISAKRPDLMSVDKR